MYASFTPATKFSLDKCTRSFTGVDECVNDDRQNSENQQGNANAARGSDLTRTSKLSLNLGRVGRGGGGGGGAWRGL